MRGRGIDVVYCLLTSCMLVLLSSFGACSLRASSSSSLDCCQSYHIIMFFTDGTFVCTSYDFTNQTRSKIISAPRAGSSSSLQVSRSMVELCFPHIIHDLQANYKQSIKRRACSSHALAQSNKELDDCLRQCPAFLVLFRFFSSAFPAMQCHLLTHGLLPWWYCTSLWLSMPCLNSLIIFLQQHFENEFYQDISILLSLQSALFT